MPLFGISLEESTVTILYIKLYLADFFAYAGGLWGLYKNYRATMKTADAAAERLQLSKEQKIAYDRDARLKFIRDNAKTHYMNVKKIAEKTETKVDDKLLLYMERFHDAMTAMFGAPPTPEEKTLMVDKSVEIHEEVKLGTAAAEIKRTEPEKTP
jgi:hypothetical protein